MSCVLPGVVPKQTYKMEEKARGRNGDRQTEAGSAGQSDGREQRRHIRQRGGARQQEAEPPMKRRICELFIMPEDLYDL